MYEYEIVPVTLLPAEPGAAPAADWESLRGALNEHAAAGYRVVAVTDGEGGSAIVMERDTRRQARDVVAVAEVESVAEAAEEITRQSATDGR